MFSFFCSSYFEFVFKKTCLHDCVFLRVVFTFSCTWYARFHGRRWTLAHCKGERRSSRATASKWKNCCATFADINKNRFAVLRSVICHWDATSRAYFVLSRVRTPSAPLTQTDGHRQRGPPDTDRDGHGRTDSRGRAGTGTALTDTRRPPRTQTDADGRH